MSKWLALLVALTTAAAPAMAQDEEQKSEEGRERPRYRVFRGPGQQAERFRELQKAYQLVQPGQDGPLTGAEVVPGRPYFFSFTEGSDRDLGATLTPVTEPLRIQLKLAEGQGLIVSNVDPDGAAARCGIRNKDILLSLGDHGLAKPEDLEARVKAAGDAKEVPLKLLRAGKPVTLKVRPVTRVTLGPVEEIRERTDYLIGVAVSVPDETLRDHLEIPEDRGLIVGQVVAKSPAEKAGLKTNDVLLSAGETPLDSSEKLVTIVRRTKDQPIEFHLLREGKETTVRVTPEKRTIKEAVAPTREAYRLWMAQPGANVNGFRWQGGPSLPGMPSMPPIPPGMNVTPFGQARDDARVEELEKELKSLREAIQELRDAVKESRSRNRD